MKSFKNYSSLLALLILWLVLYVWGLGVPHVDYTLESLCALVARNMMEKHDWILPYWGDQPYLAKPPLMNWTILVFSLPFGEINEWTIRIPSALTVLGCALILRGWARRQGWTLAGDYGAILFLFLPLVFEKGTRGEIDINLTLWVMCSLFCLYEGTRLPLVDSSRWRWILGTYIFLTLALLSKGPPALLFFFGTWLFYQTYRGWKSVGWKHHLLGWGVVAMGMAAWLIPVILRVGWDRYWQVFNEQALQRVSETTELNSAPFYFYLPSLLGGAFPAFLFFPWLKGFFQDSNRKAPLVFLGGWVISALVLFSLVAGKESRYLLPVYPAVALWGGIGVERFLQSTRQDRKVNFAYLLLGILSILILISGPALWIGQVMLNSSAMLWGLLWACLWSLAGLAALLFVRNGKPHRALAAIIFAVLVVKGFYLTAIVPDRNARKSPKVFAEQLHQLIPPEGKIYLVRMNRSYIDFYLQRPYKNLASLDDLLEYTLEQESHYFLIREKDLIPGDWEKLGERFSIHRIERLYRAERNYFLIFCDDIPK